MAFDLASAQPIAPTGGFDLSTATPVGKAPEKAPLSLKDYLAAIPETSAHLGSGAIAAPISGLAGLMAAAGKGLGLTNTDPADVVRSVQQGMTYQPQTQGGQNLSGAIGYLPQKFAQGADWAGGKTADLTGSPALGAAVNTAIQASPMLLGMKLPAGAPKIAPAVAPEVADATAAGLRLTPEQAGAGLVPRAVQSLAGSAKLERSLSKTNAPIVNDLAKQDIGVPASATLNDATFAAAKAPHNAVYNRVASLGSVPTDAAYQSAIGNLTNRTGSGSFGFDVSPAVQNLKEGYGGVTQFDAADAVAKIRQLRRDATTNQKIYDPEKNALGVAQRGVADALEDQLDRHVQTLAQSNAVPPNLISQFRAARVSLAKINSVENAMQGTNVSAKALAKQPYLSGNLKTVADAYGNFDRSLQDVSKIRDSGPFGVLDGVFGAAAGLAHPALFTSILARPLVRAALASKPYQAVGIQRALMGQPSFPGLMGTGKLLPFQQQGLLTQDQ